MVLVNSNPATIMTDPGMADSHLHRAAAPGIVIAKVIERERPDSLLPTLGGQTGPERLAMDLCRCDGVLEKYMAWR